MQRCRDVGRQGLEMQGCRDAEMLSKCEQHCKRFLGSYVLTQWPTRASAFLSLHSHNTSQRRACGGFLEGSPMANRDHPH